MCPLLLGKKLHEIYKKIIKTHSLSAQEGFPPPPPLHPAPGEVLLPASTSPQPQYLMKPSSFFSGAGRKRSSMRQRRAISPSP